MNSLEPYSRSSIIYDADFKNETITIAQPLKAFSKKAVFKELHLTTIVQGKNRKARLGVKCRDFKLIDQYLLANKKKVPAVILNYTLPIEETNIRSAFRLPLSTKYIIKTTIQYQNFEYKSPNDFSVKDVSFNGFGIVIPKTNIKNRNPFLELKVGEELALQVTLIDTDKEKPVTDIPIRALVTRINPRYSDSYVLIGLKIINLSNSNEALLNKFIHDAQIEELKRLSRKD
ncbi:MAG: PilZ domain-containing protein [Desulfobacula sp.]|nr:PilZ domain-containing protein [Desulfobacula sp.]